MVGPLNKSNISSGNTCNYYINIIQTLVLGCINTYTLTSGKLCFLSCLQMHFVSFLFVFLCSKWTSYHVLHLKLRCDIAWRNLFSPNNSNDYTFSGFLECPLYTVLTIYYKNVELYYEKYFYRDWQEILKKVQVFELHLYIQLLSFQFKQQRSTCR